jgi:hypothetical protein
MKRCSRCKRDLPLTAFARRAASRDGRQNWCRGCNTAWARSHRPRAMAIAPTVPDGMKWCRRCEQVKPLGDFARHHALHDGRQTYCRQCQADRYRMRRETAGKLVRPPSIPEGFKFCRSCQTIKSHSEWSRNASASDGLQTRCKDCARERGRRDHLKRSYGLTESEAADLFASQGGLCAICQSVPAIHIDHNHKTGAIRGMLCFRCNAALGQFGDEAETLVRAARYLLTAAQARMPMELVWTERLAQQVEYGTAS